MRPLTGECPCGAFSFSAAHPAVWTVYCHCNECRESSGAPYTLWVGFPADLVTVRGWIRWEAGRCVDVIRGFCAQCGVAAVYRDRRMLQPETYLNGAFFHEPEALVPQGHAFWSERTGQASIEDALVKWETYSRARVGMGF